MIKKLLTVLITLILLTGIFYARQITFNEASIVAENWTIDLEKNFNDQVRIFNGKEIFRDNVLVAYVFELYPKGYVIVSPQDYLPPIKFYTFSINFDNSDLFVQDVIFSGNSKIIRMVNNGDLVPEKNFKSRNMNKFKYFLREDLNNDTLSSFKADIQSAGPLLYTSWGQGDPYNTFCPIVNDQLTVTGCTPTAVAQILNYYEWPIRGSGSETYYDYWSKQTLTTNFDKEYEWWNMLDKYNDNPTDQEIEAVATLMFDVGVALHSGYDKYGTGTFSTHFNNIVKFFLYSPDLRFVRWSSYSNNKKWFALAKSQIDNGWLIEYNLMGEFGGHSVVIDGYRVDNDINMVHVNKGGGKTGYYTMDNIDSYEEVQAQSMIINFYPYIGYEKPVALPPNTIHAETVLNKSVFLSEYIITIKWSESPSKDNRIQKYIIYQRNNGEVEIIDSVDPESKSYEFRTKKLYEYSVGSFDKNHAYSEIPTFITPVLKN